MTEIFHYAQKRDEENKKGSESNKNLIISIEAKQC